MSKFVIKKIEAVVGKQNFYKLSEDDKCEFDEFEIQIRNEGSFITEFESILAYMNKVANLVTLPQTKFKDITPSKSDVKEYEIKTKHLRVYLFHQEKTGKIVVLGGKKTTQKKDIAHFRQIKQRYLEHNK